MMIVCHMTIIQVQIFPRRPSGVCPPIDNTDGSRVCATCNILLINFTTNIIIVVVIILDRFQSGGSEMRIGQSPVFCTLPSKWPPLPRVEAQPALGSNEGGWCISKPPPSSWPGHLWWAIASHTAEPLTKSKWNKPMMSANNTILIQLYQYNNTSDSDYLRWFKNKT